MKVAKVISVAAAVLLLVLTLSGCGAKYAESGTVIISGKEALKLIGTPDTVLVDAQKATSYAKEHVAGAVNIERNDIVVTRQVVNMLAPAETIEQVMGSRGISNDTQVIIYDDNSNMDAARLWWTLLAYGHENAKVVSGGLQELKRVGAQITDTDVEPTAAVFKAAPLNTSMLIEADEILAGIGKADSSMVLVDTRTLEEYNAGTIPGSVLLNYEGNNFSDGTYRSVLDIKIRYKEAGVMPEDTVVLYCRTSIRGAQTYLALYNAGYRNLKLYDGAWLDWVLDTTRPVEIPEAETTGESVIQDMS
jgi:thiosulfate/3-mercaptopyruvate sulfurtransferase